MTYLATHLLAFAIFAAVLRLSGGALLRAPALGRRLPRGAWQGMSAWILGIVYWVMGLFFLAALRGLGIPGLGIPGLVALAAVPLGAWWATRGQVPSPGSPRPDRGPGRAALLVMVVLGAVLLPSLVLTLTPTVSTDAAVYHLTVPRLWAEHGGFRDVELNVYSHFPLATELLYAAALLAQDHVLAKLLHFGCGLFVIWTLFVALRVRDDTAQDDTAQADTAQDGLPPWAVAGVASALFLANGVVVFELRVANVDLAHAAMFLVAFLALSRARDAGPVQAERFLLLAGLAAGLVAGIKVTGILGAAILATVFLPRLGASSARRAFVRFYALPVAALWLPWLAKSFAFTGNPVYPLAYGLFGGPDWSTRLGEQFTAWQRGIGMGREPLDYLLLPLRVIRDGGVGYERFDGELGGFWLAAVPLALLALRQPLGRRALWVAGLSFVVWAGMSQQLRFLVPVLPLLALAAGLAAVDLAYRLPRPRVGMALALAGALGLAALEHGRLVGPSLRTAKVFLSAEGDLIESAVPPVFRFVNVELPEDAKLLFLSHNQGFFCHREYLADSFFEASQIVEWLAGAGNPSELHQRLNERGVSHVLLDRRPLGVPYPAALGTLLGDARRATRIFQSPDGRFFVYELSGHGGRANGGS